MLFRVPHGFDSIASEDLLAVVVGRLEAAVEHVGGTTAAKAGQERGGIR